MSHPHIIMASVLPAVWCMCCMCGCGFACVCTLKPEANNGCLSLLCCALSVETRSVTEAGVSNSARLGGQDVGGIPLPLLPSTRSKGTHYHAWLFYMGPRELNSGSHACSGGPLWNVTSFQAYTSNFYSRLFYVALWHSPLIGLPDLCGAEFMKNINTQELTEVQTNSSVS